MLIIDPQTPYIPGVGNTENPELIIIMICPEADDDVAGTLLTGTRGQFLRQELGADFSKVYITTLVKQCLYSDPITRGKGLRLPTPEEVKRWLPKLCAELSLYPDARIMILGAGLMKLFFQNFTDVKDHVGRVYQVQFGNTTRQVIANFDPFFIINQQRLLPEFKQILEGAISGNMYNPFFEAATEDKLESVYKLCSYEEAIEKLQEVIQLYLDGRITEVVFDTETSNLLPWRGRIIMFSWAHSLDPKGYAVPLEVNNTIAHENLNYEIPLYNHEITERQREKLVHWASKVLATVPIVGHNLKFDIKWVVWHNWVKLEQIKLKDDTMLMASQLYGGGKLAFIQGGVGLKELCRRLLKAPNWDFALHDYLKRFRLTADRSFSNVPTGLVGKYAALDSYWNLLLYQHMKAKMRPEVYQLLDVFNKATIVFAEAEMKGLTVDTELYDSLKSSYEGHLAKLEEQIQELPTVNKFFLKKLNILIEENQKKRKPKAVDELRPLALKLRSGDHLIELIYGEDYFGFIPEKRFNTDGGKPGTNKEAIEFLLNSYVSEEAEEDLKSKMTLSEEQLAELKEKRQFLTLLAEYLRFAKTLIPRYIDPVPEESHEGSYKPEYNLIGASTGRMCLLGNTKISMLDGSEREIGTIALGEDINVYGCLPDGTILPARAKGLGLTKYTKSIVKVTLDNSQVIECTPDHRFMLRDGSYKEAQHLKASDSLMPLYRSKDELEYKAALDYNHRIVSVEVVELEVAVPVYDIEVPATHNFALTAGVFVHNSSGFHTMPNKCLRGTEQVRLLNGQKVAIKDLIGKQNFWVISRDSTGKIVPGFAHSARVTDTVTELYRVTLDNNEVIECTGNHLFMLRDGSYKEAQHLTTNDSLMPLYIKMTNAAGAVTKTVKVLKVESFQLEAPESVYDITVDKYHNFALASGVFVHNCDIKRLYKSRWAGKGGLFAAPDASQLEIRIVACLAEEYGFINAYKQGFDVHQNTAAKIYQKAFDDVTGSERSDGKTLNFGVIYGQTSKAASQKFKITMEAAEKIMSYFSDGYPALADWIKRQHKFAAQNGYIETPWGRRIPILDARNPDKWKRMDAERQAQNYPVQCFVGSTKIKMLDGTNIAIEDLIGKKNFWVYSYNNQRGKIEPCLATSAFVSGMVTKLVKIKLDNGETIECTPEHRFMLRDGSYKEAQYLQINESLMPLWEATHHIQSITLIELDQPIPVYDIEVPEFSNFALSAGIIVHNSTASDCITYAITEAYTDLKAARMNSLIVGAVHDSIEGDIYPGELFQFFQIFKEKFEVQLPKRFPWVICPLELSVELGSSWGGGLEFKLEELTSNSFVGVTSGLRKDILNLVNEASNAYKVDYEVLEKEPLTEKDFKSDVFYRDREEWTARISILAH